MTLKTKLLANVLITAAIIVAISLTSFFSMRYLQENLSYLTEKSTPFQIWTIELQRELQRCITALIKVNAAGTITEYRTFRTEYEENLSSLQGIQISLETISTIRPRISDELDKVAQELFAAAEDRIRSNEAASAANADVLQRISETSARLSNLDTSIRYLQVNYSNAFAAALDTTRKISDKLRSIEELRNLIRELQLIAITVENAQKDSTTLIARGKLKAVMARISRNEYFTANRSLAGIITGFADMLAENIRLQSVMLTQKDEESKSRAASFGKDIPYRLNDLFQTLDQETMLARDELLLASGRQGSIFEQSNRANNILLTNSELVALGLLVTGETNRLITVTSLAELDKLDSVTRALFTKVDGRVQMLESSLAALHAEKEVHMLRAAGTSLATVRNHLYAPDGMVTTLRKKLHAIEQANAAADKLHDIVIRQTVSGKESVSVAQAEREKSLIAVNSMVRRNLYQILVIGFAAIVFGSLFGFWIYRSVLRPLTVVLEAVNAQQEKEKEKANLAEAVAGGDLSRTVMVGEAMKLDPEQAKKDEMGMVLNAIAGMSEAQVTLDRAFSAMVEKVREARDSLERRVEERTEQLSQANEDLKNEICERARVEQDLRRSEQFIRNVLDTVDEGFIVIDRDFRILTANKAYCTQVGKTALQVIGSHCYEYSHGMVRPCFEEGEDCAVRTAFDTGEPSVALHRHRSAQDSIMYVETKAFPLKDSSGRVTSVIETINNISEKHLLEEERMKTQKLEAIGTLAGGIAHDFNNLLQGVFGYISMAMLTIDQKERSTAMLQQAEKALHLTVRLTNQLLTFSKGGKPVKKHLRLEPLIENAVKFALSGSHTDYRMEIAADLWPVEADEGQLAQVIQNIVLNADQAMPTGGTIVVRAKNVIEAKKAHTQFLGEGKYVEIAVQDNGVGIPEQHLQKIFDPYFTTKDKGSGLGLATSYSIIKNHGGIIDVASELGRGTTFFVYLPAIGHAREASVASVSSPVVRTGKILVMDDEEIIRNIAAEMITALGHEVDVAEHGDAAIRKYQAARESGTPFDIVILDLTIRGGMGGRETLDRLQVMDPDIKTVVSSGYSDDALVSHYLEYGFNARLTKPYDLKALRDTLNTLLIS